MEIQKRIYLIPTRTAMPDPIGSSWGEVANFSKSFGKRVLFMGGVSWDRVALAGCQENVF